MRFTAALFLIAVLACAEESGQGDVSSGPAEESGPETAAAGLPASAQQCLDLVAEARFAEAVDPCTQAAGEVPDNEEVSEALQKARASAQQASEDAASQAEALKEAGEALAQ